MTFNKAKVAIGDAETRLRQKAGSSVIWIDRWDGVLGKTVKNATHSTPVDKDGVVAIGNNGLYATSSPRALTWLDAKAMAKKIDDMNVSSDHLQVKSDDNWKRMYQYASRSVPYMDQTGALGTKTLPTMPCHNCGVVLPFEFLQVDHQKPQSDTDGLHILKMLRVLGGTTAVATGSKGLAFVGNTLNIVDVFPKARDRSYNYLANATPANKWATNEKGSAFLSLIAYVSGMDDVQRMCKNSLLNLAPLCSACNLVKSDWTKPIV